MSKAVFCDRCKEMFPESPEGHVYVRVGLDSPNLFNPCFPANVPTAVFKGDRKYDLCPSCQDEFSKFMRIISAEGERKGGSL